MLKTSVPSPLRKTAADFRRAVLRWYGSHRRDLPWRRTRDPWRILVSEIMLQQTQVDRVIPKYESFLGRWPTPAAFASASLGDALDAWSGLGYNRRCRHLHEAAKAVVTGFGGKTPVSVDALESLPGIGPYTARAVASFACNADVTLWDTNVRRIALRVFFGGEFARRLPSKDGLEAVLGESLPIGRSRDWHNALMDFGSSTCVGRAPLCSTCPLRAFCRAAPAFLAGKSRPRVLQRAQPKFEGSRRQARGAVLRMLTGGKHIRLATVVRTLKRPDAADIVAALEKEGMLTLRGGRICLPKK